MRILLVSIFAALLAASGAVQAAPFTASFRWCSKTPQSTTSPAFTLSGVPKGTKTLALAMTDHQASYNHGGGTVPYSGGKIPCGAIASGWVGPFPPSGETHTYEFTIDAQDASGKVVATAHATRKFPE
jgi:phosphatidylethanolamine-binding protein (PEBP) family uncharacterized protein